MPSFNGGLSLAALVDEALVKVEIFDFWFQGDLSTTGSRSYGIVERKEVITSFKASIEVDMNPTDDAIMSWPGFYNGVVK